MLPYSVHDILLKKLSLYGIDTEWFQSYLAGHTQQVQITNGDGTVSVSKSKPNEIGIFQGGSLSCILYMIYANDLSLFIPDSVSMVQFADDTQLLITEKTRHPFNDYQNGKRTSHTLQVVLRP